MKIQIKEKLVELRYSFRALMLYENIMSKSFNPQTLTEVLTFFYAVIISSEKDIELTYDEFINLIDEQPNLVREFSEWLSGQVQKNNELMLKNPKAAKAKNTKKAPANF